MPVTKSSLDAYKEVQTKITQSQKRILKVLENEKEPFCQKRILELLHLNGYRLVQINQVTPRVNELVEMGLLMEVGRRKTKYSNVSVNHYEIAKNLFNNN